MTAQRDGSPGVLNESVEWIVRRERAVVLVSLGVVVALSWWFLLTSDTMTDMGAMEHTHGQYPSRQPVAIFAMWAVMMTAMMLPSAAPAILLFAALMRSRATVSAIPGTAIFAAGYVVVWMAFSLIATTAQLELQHAAVVSTTMQSTSAVLGGALLIAAGVYQLTPLKDACIRHCRSPIQFFTRQWRPGRAGALRLGLFHGAYCVGCCWVLMGLLFVGGVMNLLWVAGLTVFILAEKTAFLGTRWARIASAGGLVAAGLIVLGWRH